MLFPRNIYWIRSRPRLSTPYDCKDGTTLIQKEGIQGVDLDPLDHAADVVRLPVQVKVCDGDDENGDDDDNADEDGR